MPQSPPPIAMDTSDLTQSSIKLAQRLEPRLRAGAKTFHNMRLVIVALAPLAIAGFGLGVYSMSLAKRSDVETVEAAESRHHAALEQRTAVLEAQRAVDGANTSKALDAINAHLTHIDDVLLDVRIRLGAAPTAPLKHGR